MLERGVGDLALGEVLADRLDHPPHLVDPGEVVVGGRLHLIGQLLDEPGAAERVGRVGRSGLEGDDLLGAERDPDRLLGRQGERLVEGVGVQRLGPAEDRGEGLDRGADDVVERLLGGQRDARRLGVEAEPHRLLAPGAVGVAHLARPDPARRPVLRDLLEEVDVGVEEERETGGEVVDVEAALDRPLDVGEAVLEREGELLLGGRSGLADVVAGDRDRVPARHLLRAPLDHVGDEAQRRLDREAPLLLGDVLLEDVGLDRPGELVRRDPLLLADEDVEGEQDRRRGVDRHRGADPAERDSLEELFHVVEAVDGDALAADLAEAADVIGVVAHQGRHVERGREPGLAVVEQVVEALVGLLDRPEPGELAHRPEPPPVHRRVGTAGERVLAGAADRLLGISRGVLG